MNLAIDFKKKKKNKDLIELASYVNNDFMCKMNCSGRL